ncbi:MAG: hypothetical protein JWM21_4456 [Acidobacteria bacterium]|nr:hypothetical protein [Acidobacteriota bacterium]
MSKSRRPSGRNVPRLVRHPAIKTVALCLSVIVLLITGAAQRRISGPAGLKNPHKVREVRNRAGVNVDRHAAQDPYAQDEIVGTPWTGEKGISRTTTELMQAQANTPLPASLPVKPERDNFEHENRAEDPNAKPLATTPGPALKARTGNQVLSAKDSIAFSAPQAVTTNFNSVTAPAETSKLPPDTMGTVGPTQFLLFINGRLKTFTKATGIADGVINANPDVFFGSVMSPPPGGGINFTSDPQVRYDRLTGRWILTIVDLPSTSPASIGDRPNRLLIAASDAASAGVISAGTVWTFYFVQQDTLGGGPSNGEFLDYPSLGVDNNALYVGGVMYDAAGGILKNTAAFVIRKSSILSGGPIVTTAFRNLISGDGPNAPRGVDNYDPSANEGYFIGISNAALGRLIIRRVSNPGGSPAISGNIALTVSSTSNPINVDHLGDTNGANGDLDTLKDRLMAAHIRNGRLWTAHANAVTSAGISSEVDPQRRNGVRWYELNGVRSSDNGGVPVVVQSGTIFDSAPTVASARQYWMPTVMVSGQGHAALGFSTAGTPNRIDAATSGRLAGDTAGTTQAVTLYTVSGTAYNPAADPGGANGRRWGDYSFTSLDPIDDMTMWTVQQYCSAADTYGLQVAKLMAPPPATPATSSPSSVSVNQPSVNVTITGTSASGSGFYDPGANLATPALPFSHISASVTGVTVNSVSYTDPTHVTLNLSTVGASPGPKNVTITNPDGQSMTGTGILNVSGPSAAPATVSGRIITGAGTPVGGVTIHLSGSSSLTSITDGNGDYRFSNVDTGGFYTITPELANYHFSPANRSFSLVGDKTDAAFTAAADAAIVANAIDTSEYFVRQQYLDFLGREPDAGGFNYWRDQANSCNGDADCVRTKRIDVSAAFFLSQEFKDTGSFVYRLYKGALGRQLRYSEFSADRAQVVGGPNLESSKTTFAAAFVQRAEFADKYQGKTTAEAFVDALLQTMNDSSGVNLSSARAALINRYNEGAGMNASRALVVRQLVDNDTFAGAVYNQQFVAMQYFGYLRRTPDADGLNFWLNVLNNDASNYRGMVCSFITSAEYQRRFGTVVSHSNAECGR